LVGAADGFLVGFLVGELVGFIVGFAVGDLVGDAVGGGGGGKTQTMLCVLTVMGVTWAGTLVCWVKGLYSGSWV
jgi:hypothetical protein